MSPDKGSITVVDQGRISTERFDSNGNRDCNDTVLSPLDRETDFAMQEQYETPDYIFTMVYPAEDATRNPLVHDCIPVLLVYDRTNSPSNAPLNAYHNHHQTVSSGTPLNPIDPHQATAPSIAPA